MSMNHGVPPQQGIISPQNMPPQPNILPVMPPQATRPGMGQGMARMPHGPPRAEQTPPQSGPTQDPPRMTFPPTSGIAPAINYTPPTYNRTGEECFLTFLIRVAHYSVF